MKSADKIIKEEIANHLMEEQQNYMFFQNLKTICHAAQEMLKMNPAEVDKVLSNGHAWAVDHIATSADDIEEVYHFLTDKNEGKITEAVTKTVLLDLTGINGNETPYGSVYRGTAKVDGKDYKSYIEFDDTEWIGLPIESSVYKIVLSKLGIKVNDWKHNKQQFLRAFDTDYLYGKRWRLTYSNGKLAVDRLISNKKPKQ